MPDKKPKRTVQRVDPASINIEAHVRDNIDIAGLASALIDVLPLLDAKTQAELEAKGAMLREQMESKSSKDDPHMV